MPDKKISQLPAAITVEVTDLIPVADPTTGDAEKATLDQLPFIPKGGTLNTVPRFDANGVLISSGFRDIGNTLALDRRTFLTSIGTYGLGISMGNAVVSGEQHPLDITSTAPYADIALANTASGFAAIRLACKSGATFIGTTQIFAGPSGETVMRSSPGNFGIVPQGAGGKFQVRGQTAVDNTSWFTIFNTGNARFDGGSTDPGVRLYVGGKVAVSDMTEYADNAAAVTAGLGVGTLYRTGDLVKVVHA